MLVFDLPRIDEIEPFLDSTDEIETKKAYQEPLDEEKLVPGSVLYKKARKMRQNRESAQRSRKRKLNELETVKLELDKMTQLNNQLAIQNEFLKSENQTLQKDLDYYKSLVTKPKGNSKLLVTTTAFTIACIFMILQGETTGNSPQIGNRTLKSFRTDEPELGGIWFFICLFVAIVSGVFYIGGLIRYKP